MTPWVAPIALPWAKMHWVEPVQETAELLGLPEGYRVGVVPASDTGAVEMIMWSVLGERPVDIFAWESFGKGWLTDATKQLKLQDLNSYTADYGLSARYDPVQS